MDGTWSAGILPAVHVSDMIKPVSNYPNVIGIIPILLESPESRRNLDQEKEKILILKICSHEHEKFITMLLFFMENKPKMTINLPSLFDRDTRLKGFSDQMLALHVARIFFQIITLESTGPFTPAACAWQVGIRQARNLTGNKLV